MSKENKEIKENQPLEVSNSKVDVKSSFKVDVKSSFDVEKAFCGLPRSSHGAFPMYGKTKKGSFTDKSKYIPLYQSVLNLQQGKSVSQASSVNLVTQRDYEFPDGKVPKGWKSTDGLLSMDIADISQMQRDLEERISAVEKELKSADQKQNLLLIRDSIKNKQKISDGLLSSIADKALSGILSKYNDTIQ